MPTVEQRHRVFADAYLAFDYNATRAYKYVYGDAIADNSAASMGSILLRDPKVAEYIAEAKAAQQARLHIRQDEPVKAYLNVLKADVRNLFDADGRLVPIVDLDDETANAIESVQVKRYTNRQMPWDDHEVTKIKFCSKIAAANALSDILGLTKADVVQSGNTNIIARQVIIVAGREIEF